MLMSGKCGNFAIASKIAMASKVATDNGRWRALGARIIGGKEGLAAEILRLSPEETEARMPGSPRLLNL